MNNNEGNNNKDAKILTEHFDGIVEHDHPLPNWWLATFILTIIFSIFYYGYYELLDGPTLDQELSETLTVLQTQGESSKENNAIVNLDELIKVPANIQIGKKVFGEKCFMCHGDKGQGLIGPNITDNFWIHGNKPSEILHVIQKGVPEKGMVPWEAVLSDEEQIGTVAYIKSLSGSNPAGAKAPEGAEYKE